MNLQAMQETARSVCGLLKLLANEQRLLVLCELVECERTVGELAASLRIRQPAMSQQLGRLRAEGLVGTRRDGQNVYYRLVRGDVADLIAYLHDAYCGAETLAGDAS